MVATGIVSLTTRVLDILEKLNLNYFRVHLLWFTINPLVWSVIFYLSNGRFHVSYIDSLFLCVSAQTVTGLSPLNASTLTGFQQAILFYLMAVGNYTVTSFVMVLIRKHYFVARVLKERPDRTPFSRLGSIIRSKTFAVFDISNHRPPASTQDHREVDQSQPHPPVEIRSATQSPEGDDITQASQPKTSDEVALDEGTRKQKAPPLPHVPLGNMNMSNPSPATPTALCAEDNVLTTSPSSISGDGHAPATPGTPFQNFFGDPLQINDSPKMLSDTAPSSRPPVHFALGPLESQPRRHSPLATHQALPLNRTLSINVNAVPGPRHQGTGLFFSSTRERSQSRDVTTANVAATDPQVPVVTIVQSPSINASPPSKQPPTYEKGFGGFPTPLALTTRLAERLAPTRMDRLKRKLTINEGALYVPAASNRLPRDAEKNVPLSHTVSTGVSQRLSQARLRHHPPSLVPNDTRRHGASQDVVYDEPVQNESHLVSEPLAPPHLHSSHSPNIVIPEHLRHSRPVYNRHDSHTSSNDWVDDLQEGVKKTVKYITQGVLQVGRNSAFNTDDLTDEQLEELGGVEYRALRALSWILGLYFVGTQLVTFAILTAYLYSTSKYDFIFAQQPRNVPKSWFVAFQAMSAYTGGGLTLVDQGMVPFRAAYTIVIFQGMLIIAGNMGLAILLRLIVWILSKFAPERHQEPLQFLLDHPRRCYLYLFPSHQTWFLVVVFLTLTFIEWFGFLILDIGLETIEAIPLGDRVLAGLFQSVAVRASGFTILPLSSIAPAVKFLYLVMMYISAYPIAMSIRSTNVYEQRSLGIYGELTPAEAAKGADPDVDENAARLVKGKQGEVLFSKYLGMHIRRQLSYDLWWLAAAMFLICIVERTQIMNPDNEAWFNQFQIMFELVSAYATVGLSLGIPTDNYSFSGALRPLSKFILCVVMIRGRHRDLPQAIDRAILLPHEFNRSRVDEKGMHVIDQGGEQHAAPQSAQPGPQRKSPQGIVDEKKAL